MDEVLSSTSDRVGIVTLNRPRALNALSRVVMTGVAEALEAFDADPGIGAMVLTGGPTIFAAGADIKEMADATSADMLARDTIALWDRLGRLRKPLIAAVAGYALGGGCEMAMLCDIIVAAQTAQFGQPEINLGLIPGAGGTQRLTRALGKSVAMDMILTGRMLGADEALQRGLVARVVPADQVIDDAVRLGNTIAARAPVSVQLAKDAVRHAYEAPLTDGVAYERSLFYLLFGTVDTHEGMQAFIEKRQPRYEGR